MPFPQLPQHVVEFLDEHPDTSPPPPSRAAPRTEILRRLARRYKKWTALPTLLGQLRDPDAPQTEAELMEAFQGLRTDLGEHCTIETTDGRAMLSKAHRRLLVITVQPGFTICNGAVPVFLLPLGDVLLFDRRTRRPVQSCGATDPQGDVLAALMEHPYAALSAEQLAALTGVKGVDAHVGWIRRHLDVRVVETPIGLCLDGEVLALKDVELALDRRHGRAWQYGKPLPHGTDGFAVADRIASAAGTPVGAAQIALALWGSDALPTRAAIAVTFIRAQLERPDGTSLLEGTSEGYHLTRPDAVRWITGWSPDGTPELQHAPPAET